MCLSSSMRASLKGGCAGMCELVDGRKTGSNNLFRHFTWCPRLCCVFRTHPILHTHLSASSCLSRYKSESDLFFCSSLLSFPSQNAALQHLFIRKSFRPFKCTHCGKAFRDKEKLDQHLRVHGRDAYTFSCHICSKSFMSDSALEDHILVHTENRSYSCLLCSEAFERLDLLKDHVGVHAVDGFFTCPSCKKTFTDFIQVSKNHVLKLSMFCHDRR